MSPRAQNAVAFYRRKIALTRLAIIFACYLNIIFDRLLILSVPTTALIISLRMTGAWKYPSFIFVIFFFLFALVLLSWREFSRQTMSENNVAAWLDYKSSGGGMLMTIEESERLDPSWDANLKKLRLAKIDLRITRLVLPLLFSILLLGLAISIPVVDISRKNALPTKLDISMQLGKIKEDLCALEDKGLLSEQRGDEILEEIKRLEETCSALKPAKTFEHIDAIEATLRESAENGFANFAKSIKLATEFEFAVSLLKSGPNEEGEKRIRECAEKIQKIFENNPELQSMLIKGGLLSEQAIKDFMDMKFPCDSASLEKIALSMKSLKESSCKAAKEICDSGLCSKSAQELESYLQNADIKPLASSENADMKMLSPEQEKQLYGTVGEGGISRGPGDAPIFFGSESPEIAAGTKYKIESEKINPSIGENVGVSFSAPEATEHSIKVNSLNAEYSHEKGGSDRTQNLSPSEKAAVIKFFKK